MNDRGGVHTNSSLLNNLAWRLYEKGNMTLEEGRVFWFTVDCSMVPGTDYPQLAEILPFALRAAGLEKYSTDLQRALDATRLGIDDIPDVFDEDRALMTLYLPDNPIFDDEQWIMQIVTVDVDRLIDKALTLVKNVLSGDYSELPESIQTILESLSADHMLESETAGSEEESGLLESIMNALLGGGNEDALNAIFTAESEDQTNAQSSDEDEALQNGVSDSEEDLSGDDNAQEEEATGILKEIGIDLLQWALGEFRDTYYSGNTNAGQDGHTMRIVSVPGYSLPILIHGVYNDNTSSLEEQYMLIYIGGKWFDPNSLTMIEQDDVENGMLLSPEVQEIIDNVLGSFDEIESYNDVLEKIFYHIEGGQNNVVPSTGLENATPQLTQPPTKAPGETSKETNYAPPKKSRPKLEEDPAATQIIP